MFSAKFPRVVEMAAIEKGKQVMITRGADAGKKAEVVEIIDRNTLKIKVGDKERKINLRHVEPLKS